ncbi:MAG TPA: very short patch repair endonuclease [Bacteroidia bacterium]|nr:very short patch repair endonuclease [Bacteroidia bacterium]
MADVHTKAQRSYNMSRIKGKNTKPEILVRKFLYSKGFRFRIHDKKLPGKPDIVLQKYKTVIFVHGCFWHGHKNCKYAKLPETRKVFWKKKIERNRELDKLNKQKLRKEKLNVIEIWQCQMKRNFKKVEEKILSSVAL